MIRASKGFTLLELMTVTAMIAIFATMAIPTYSDYIRRAEQSQARAEALRVSNLLDQWRARNLTFRNFDLTKQPNILQSPTGTVVSDTASMLMYVPAGSTGLNYKYIVRIVDLDSQKSLLSADATGRGYILRLEPKDTRNKIMLLQSNGLRCQSNNGVTNSDFVAYKGCGTGAEAW